MPKCKCGAQIVFMASPEGYVTPCDPLPVLYWSNPRGVGRIVTADGRVHSCDFDGDPKLASGVGLKPHWATCPRQFSKFHIRNRKRRNT